MCLYSFSNFYIGIPPFFDYYACPLESRSLVFLQKIYIFLFVYSTKVYRSLFLKRTFSKFDLFLLLNVYSSMILVISPFSFDSPSFGGDWTNLTSVCDLLTIIKLRLSSSIGASSFFLSNRIAFFISSISNISFQLMRFSLSLISIFSMRLTKVWDLLCWVGMRSFLTSSSLKYSFTDRYFRFWSKNGYWPLKAIL